MWDFRTHLRCYREDFAEAEGTEKRNAAGCPHRDFAIFCPLAFRDFVA
jgi:hypothetical protein